MSSGRETARDRRSHRRWSATAGSRSRTAGKDPQRTRPGRAPCRTSPPPTAATGMTSSSSRSTANSGPTDRPAHRGPQRRSSRSCPLTAGADVVGVAAARPSFGRQDVAVEREVRRVVPASEEAWRVGRRRHRGTRPDPVQTAAVGEHLDAEEEAVTPLSGPGFPSRRSRASTCGRSTPCCRWRRTPKPCQRG